MVPVPVAQPSPAHTPPVLILLVAAAHNNLLLLFAVDAFPALVALALGVLLPGVFHVVRARFDHALGHILLCKSLCMVPKNGARRGRGLYDRAGHHDALALPYLFHVDRFRRIASWYFLLTDLLRFDVDISRPMETAQKPFCFLIPRRPLVYVDFFLPDHLGIFERPAFLHAELVLAVVEIVAAAEAMFQFLWFRHSSPYPRRGSSRIHPWRGSAVPCPLHVSF